MEIEIYRKYTHARFKGTLWGVNRLHAFLFLGLLGFSQTVSFTPAHSNTSRRSFHDNCFSLSRFHSL